MYSATPIGGSTASERAGSTRTTNTAMGTKFNAEYTFCFRTEMRTGTRPGRRYRRHHYPPATGYGRP
ncbi:hypothetical protein [Salinirussus salinus]|jgi:hypothetical protein|uniref:hypothetical protein n=1 Tax=Salinirussus salinus TaxID=1198300 RepID=UPI00135697E7|nr:hypothetical protein [Salinirussus salinus]